MEASSRTGDPNYHVMPRRKPCTLPRRTTMVFNAESRLADDPRGVEPQPFTNARYIRRTTMPLAFAGDLT